MSGNGLQYASKDFSTVAKQPYFRHFQPKIPSVQWTSGKISPDCQKDNSKADGKYSNIRFLEYKTKPLRKGYSSEETKLLISRKLISILPVIPDELKPKVPARAKELMTQKRRTRKSIMIAVLSPYHPFQ